MKKITCLFLVFALTIPLTFAGGGKERKPTGRLTIYTSMYQEGIDIVKQELSKEFPRCKIEFVYGGTGRLEHMIATEKASGRLGCDILMVSEPTYSLELKQSGLLHQHISREAVHLAFDYDIEGYWYPVRINNMILAYNPARNPKSSIPNSFYDFAHNRNARGAISIRNPEISGTSLATLLALKDKYGYEYIDALSAQNVRIEYGTEGAMSRLESGEYRVIMILEESILHRREKEGSKLEVIYPEDGTIMIPSPIMIINNRWSANRNTKAAEVIIDWFLSEKGQNAIVSSWMHSVRIDFPRIPYDSIPTHTIRKNSIPVNWENIKQRNEVLDRFERNR